MRCPGCGKEVPDGTTICNHCDHIIDKTFLGDGYTDVEDENEEDYVPTMDVPRPHFARRRRPPPTPEPPPATHQGQTRPEARGRIRPAQDTPVDSASAPSESLSIEGSRIAQDMEGFLHKLGQAYRVLGIHDKMVVGGSLAMFLFTFLPWVAVPGSSWIGLERNGGFLLILSAAMIGLIYVRHLASWQDKERFVLYGQLGVAALGLLFLLGEMVSAHKIRMPIDTPQDSALGAGSVQGGLVLCLLASLVVLAGVVLLFRQKALGK